MYVITFLILQTVPFIHSRFVSLNKGYTKYSCSTHDMIMLHCALIGAKVSKHIEDIRNDINQWMNEIHERCIDMNSNAYFYCSSTDESIHIWLFIRLFVVVFSTLLYIRFDFKWFSGNLSIYVPHIISFRNS